MPTIRDSTILSRRLSRLYRPGVAAAGPRASAGANDCAVIETNPPRRREPAGRFGSAWVTAPCPGGSLCRRSERRRGVLQDLDARRRRRGPGSGLPMKLCRCGCMPLAPRTPGSVSRSRNWAIVSDPAMISALFFWNAVYPLVSASLAAATLLGLDGEERCPAPHPCERHCMRALAPSRFLDLGAEHEAVDRGVDAQLGVEIVAERREREEVEVAVRPGRSPAPRRTCPGSTCPPSC